MNDASRTMQIESLNALKALASLSIASTLPFSASPSVWLTYHSNAATPQRLFEVLHLSCSHQVLSIGGERRVWQRSRRLELVYSGTAGSSTRNTFIVDVFDDGDAVAEDAASVRGAFTVLS